MKKIRRRTIIILILVALFLFFPISAGPMNDGGTMEYSAVTYKVVKWHRHYSDGNGNHDTYEKTSVYRFPHNYRDIDDLWKPKMEKSKS